MSYDTIPMIRALKSALATDPVAIRKLLGTRVPCNAALIDHPTIIVGKYDDGRGPCISPLGVLNGILASNGIDAIAAVYDDDENIVDFCEYEKL